VRGRRGAGWYAQRWPLLGDKQHTKAYYAMGKASNRLEAGCAGGWRSRERARAVPGSPLESRASCVATGAVHITCGWAAGA